MRVSSQFEFYLGKTFPSVRYVSRGIQGALLFSLSILWGCTPTLQYTMGKVPKSGSTSHTATPTPTPGGPIASVVWVIAPVTSYTASNVTPMTTFKAEIKDTSGTVKTTDSTTTLTLSLTTGSGGLLGTVTETVSSGVATFNDIAYTTAENIVITATENTTGSNFNVSSSSITVNPAAFSLTESYVTAPATVNSGASVTVTLTALDVYDNANPSGITAETFASTLVGGTGSFGSITPLGNGVFTASFTGGTTGLCTLSATLNASPVLNTSDITITSPILAWSPLTNDFGRVAVGANSSTQTFTLTNSGDGDATGCSAPSISDITNFTINTDNCGTSDLTASLTCTVIIQGNPVSAGPKTATLSRTCTIGGTPSTTSNQINVTGIFSVLHTFTAPHPVGRVPMGDLIISGSTLYGMTMYGGNYDKGTIFSVPTAGGAATVLHHFAGGATDGSTPRGSLILSGGILYGMTQAGGTVDGGVVFSIPVTGGTLTVLASFTGANGRMPYGNLILSGGIFYGMTNSGGPTNLGVIFSVPVTGGSTTTLHTFAAGAGGAQPNGSLVFSAGILYGVTSVGGTSNLGTIFSIATDGTGYTVLHSFAGGAADGSGPMGSLIFSAGTLYGTTFSGGTTNSGTIFSILTTGASFAILAQFNYVNGANPYASLILSAGTLYGTASAGGANTFGSIFSVPSTGGSITALNSFTGGTDGGLPFGSLVLSGSTLYGMTNSGGINNCGTVFSIPTTGGSVSVLNSFLNSTDGASPQGSLILVGGIFYGTASTGGTGGHGVVFSIPQAGGGLTILHNFNGGTTDGDTPLGSLIFSGGILYGTTDAGGATNDGTIFSIATDGTGFTLVHSLEYNADGASPYASLLLSAGTLYGTTSVGGPNAAGTIFSVVTDGTGFATLYGFDDLADGGNPTGNLTLAGGTLYGTTQNGGVFGAGAGTLFSIATDGSGFSTIYTFSGGADGAFPVSDLILSGGTFYGTTSGGGSLGNGTVYSIAPNGTGFTTLANFTVAPDGANPRGNVLVSGGTLYGMTNQGGANNIGSIYSVPITGGSVTILYDFTGGADSGTPLGDLVLSNGTLYGMTLGAGSSVFGNIFAFGL